MIFEKYKQAGSLLLELTSGFDLYGLGEEGIDVEENYGIFIGPRNWFYGLGINKNLSQCSENNKINEIGKFIVELSNSNPEALTILFAPEDKIRYKNDLLKQLFEYRNNLITSQAVKTFRSASNKLYNWQNHYRYKFNTKEKIKEIEEKTVLDFCYIPSYYENNKIVTVSQFLKENQLKEKHCTAVKLRSGINLYAVYYDFAADPYLPFDKFLEFYCKNNKPKGDWERIDWKNFHETLITRIKKLNYKGLMEKDSLFQIKQNSCHIPKDEEPIFIFQFNNQSLDQYKKEYHEYQTWKSEQENLSYQRNYNGKIMVHCVRLLQMASEIYHNGKIKVDRSTGSIIDKNFLLDIKHNKVDYSEIMSYLDKLSHDIELSFGKKLPIRPNQDELDKILIDIRNNYYKDHDN